MHIGRYILWLCAILLPAMFANAIPVLVKGIPWWAKPISQRFLGSNKTWRWCISAILAWIFVQNILFLCGIQDYMWYQYFFEQSYIQQLDSIRIHSALWASLWFGAIVWDMVESFFKRKQWIPSWAIRQPWDQIDYILWTIIFSLWIISRWLYYSILACMIWWIISYIAHYSAYMLKMISSKH